MKKIILLALISAPSITLGQVAWSTAGNALGSGGVLGTTTSQPVSIRTNGIERINIGSTGNIVFSGLTGSGSGLMQLSSTGVASRLNFPNDALQLLNGNGGWSDYATLSGWNPSTGIITTTRKLGIGVTTPAQALEVSGNGIFSGSVSASSFDVGGVATVQGHLNISNSVIHHAYDATLSTRNEIYTTDHEYYINSNASYNYNTILNQGNLGKVGIGTSSPGAKLHVIGGAKLEGGTSIDSLTFASSYTLKTKALGGITGIGFGPSSTPFAEFAFPGCIDKGTASLVTGVSGFTETYSINGSVVMGHNGSIGLIDSYSSNSSYADLMLNYFCGKNVGICTGSSGGNVYMTTVNSGKIGIGTNIPTDKVEMKTGYFSLHIGNALYSGLNYGTSYIGFNAARTDADTWKTDSDGSNNGGALIYGNVQGDMFFSTIPRTGTTGQSGIADATILNNTRLYIASTGAVGIGTQCVPSGFKMAVDGKIICEELHVKLSNSSGCWPDYVFEKDHKRMSLHELEQYLCKEKHLPNVPTANQVKEGGVNVAEMEKILLEKIEELSLYIIELNKEIEKLKTNSVTK